MSSRAPRRANLIRALAGGLFAVLLLAPAASATADAATDGFWYFDAFHIRQAHDAGFTGKGVTIVVVDTPINLEVPTLQGADIDVLPSICYDESGALIPPTSTDLLAEHGTNIVSYLVGSGKGYGDQPGVKGIVPDAHIIYMSSGHLDDDGSVVCSKTKDGTIDYPTGYEAVSSTAIHAGIEAGARIVSISSINVMYLRSEAALAEALNRGIVVLGALENETGASESLGDFPSGSNGVVGVQSAQSNGQIQARAGDVDINGDPELHFDPDTDVVGPGFQVVWQGDQTWDQLRLADGTSIATPIVAGFVALVAQKYPDATGNQLIQTLIRNTGTEDHELLFDSENLYGYGIASATHMLAVDPTQYEDVNPLIIADDKPTAADIADPSALLAEVAIADDFVGDVPEVEVAPFLGSLVLPLALGALALVLIVLVIVVLVRRSTRRAS